MPPSIVDYSNLGGQNDAMWNDQAPSVAPAGAGNDTVLQIYVPAENTVLDYGAGAIPGIRMATDHHAHLTAGTPRTTISLGKAAGPSIGGPDGLNIFTAGAKTEEVTQYTFEHYHAAKQERVDGNWASFCDGSLTRKVVGVVGDDFAKDYGLKVGGNYVQQILGDCQVNVTGNCEVKYGGTNKTTYTGSNEDHYLDPKYDYHWGSKFSTFIGVDFSANMGEKMAIYVGEAHTVNLGISSNMTVAIDRNLNFGGNITSNLSFVISTTLMGRSKTIIDFSEKDASVNQEKMVLTKSQVHIMCATLKVVK